MTSLIFMLYFGCVLSICQSCILRHVRVTLDIEIVYDDSLSLWLLDKGIVSIVSSVSVHTQFNLACAIVTVILWYNI